MYIQYIYIGTLGNGGTYLCCIEILSRVRSYFRNNLAFACTVLGTRYSTGQTPIRGGCAVQDAGRWEMAGSFPTVPLRLRALTRSSIAESPVLAPGAWLCCLPVFGSWLCFRHVLSNTRGFSMLRPLLSGIQTRKRVRGGARLLLTNITPVWFG
jgi:hypothetical protein